MDLNDIRNIVTLASFVLFAGLAIWTWRPARQTAHDNAAQLPFEGEVGDALADPLADAPIARGGEQPS